MSEFDTLADIAPENGSWDPGPRWSPQASRGALRSLHEPRHCHSVSSFRIHPVPFPHGPDGDDGMRQERTPSQSFRVPGSGWRFEGWKPVSTTKLAMVISGGSGPGTR